MCAWTPLELEACFVLLLGILKPVSPTWDIFVKYTFVPELTKKEKYIYCVTQLQPTNAALRIVPLLAC